MRECRIFISSPYSEIRSSPGALSLFLENNQMELVDRTEAIKVLDKIRADHAKRTCQRTSQQIANAFNYAIEVIKRLPEIKQ